MSYPMNTCAGCNRDYPYGSGHTCNESVLLELRDAEHRLLMGYPSRAAEAKVADLEAQCAAMRAVLEGDAGRALLAELERTRHLAEGHAQEILDQTSERLAVTAELERTRTSLEAVTAESDRWERGYKLQIASLEAADRLAALVVSISQFDDWLEGASVHRDAMAVLDAYLATRKEQG